MKTHITGLVRCLASFCPAGEGSWCPDCPSCDEWYAAPAVYRPHRKAVVQACGVKRIPGLGQGYHVIDREARLGCEEARARVKRRRRIANGVRLGRWSWAWGPRGHVRSRHDLRVPLLSYISEGW